MVAETFLGWMNFFLMGEVFLVDWDFSFGGGGGGRLTKFQQLCSKMHHLRRVSWVCMPPKYSANAKILSNI